MEHVLTIIQHVLYLAIVNMPTDEELDAATAILSEAQTAKHE